MARFDRHKSGDPPEDLSQKYFEQNALDGLMLIDDSTLRHWLTLVPQLSRIEPVDPRGISTRFLHQVLRSAGTIATLAIPQRDEDDPFAAKSSC